MDPLEAISPVDGRYSDKTASLRTYFSESALFRYRLQTEVEYFIALCSIPLPPLQEVPQDTFSDLRALYREFTTTEAREMKEIEATTNHDVKAVEYYLKEQLERMELGNYKEFIHFGLTSQDINNTAFPKMLKEATQESYLPLLENVISQLKERQKEWNDIPMLARTHGQPASPTRLGKEIGVFVERLEQQLELLEKVPFTAKFGGASGNMNAHKAAYPDIDWPNFANRFVEEQLGLTRSHPTTQIEHYDHLATLFDNCKRLNTILIDLCRDIWTYISLNYFGQKTKKGEVGSSTMPHKVNPIDFENAEGNLDMARSLYDHLSRTLPISRLQRDLSDSTVLRNIGVPMAHSVIALRSIRKGLDKLKVNEESLQQDLENNWAVIAEAVQTILRREGVKKPYEQLKELTRGNREITRETIHNFIDDLDVNNSVKEELKQITPHNYIGF